MHSYDLYDGETVLVCLVSGVIFVSREVLLSLGTRDMQTFVRRSSKAPTF